MKSRNGFVSNSSSSSFILVGIKKKLDDLNSEKMAEIMDHAGVEYDKECPEDDFWDYCYNDDLDGVGYIEEGYIGTTVARWDDCDGIKELDIKPADFFKVATSIKKIFGDETEVKVYCGMTYG